MSKYSIENLPSDVVRAMAISMQKMVSQEMYNEFRRIVGEYPDYFPQEYAYHYVVPKEVHEAHHKEWRKVSENLNYARPVQKFGESDWDYIMRSFDHRGEWDRNYKLMKKKVWNKHYKKYKIKFDE